MNLDREDDVDDAVCQGNKGQTNQETPETQGETNDEADSEQPSQT